MRATVVIVSYRTRELTLACLDSVFACTRHTPLEVVLVDNGSDDGTAEAVAACFPQVRLLALAENAGFARGCNVGAAVGSGEVVVLLNPDTVVLPGALDALVAFCGANPQAGLVGGRTLRPDGSLDPRSCWDVPSLRSLTCFALGLTAAFRGTRLDPESIPGFRRDHVREVGIVTGCLLAVRRAVWDELGGLDESFFMYGEDADLALRAAARGYRPQITPDAVIVHHVGASSPSATRKAGVLAARVALVRKHWPPWRADVAVGLLRAGAAIRAAAAVPLDHVRGGRSPWRDVWQERAAWAA